MRNGRQTHSRYRTLGLCRSITWVILQIMKTAISIRDELFEAAERTAKVLGISRSELYTKAVGEFVERHADERVTEQVKEDILGGTAARLLKLGKEPCAV